MSRVFDNNAANFITGSGVLTGDAVEATFGAWVKETGSTSFGKCVVGFSQDGTSSYHRRYLRLISNDGSVGGFADDVNITSAVGAFARESWYHLALRAKTVGGTRTFSVWLNGVNVAELTASSRNGFVVGQDDVLIGQAPGGSQPFQGWIAHVFAFTRALSDAEMLSLGQGGDPAGIDATGRYLYYPMTDASLTNEWNADSGVGTLTVNGTVAVATGDNPTITPAVLPPSVTVTQAEITPGGTISGTYTGYETVPTTLTVSDGTNTITITSPTISDNGDGTGTFSGTMPSLPTSGTANLILFGNVTVELS